MSVWFAEYSFLRRFPMTHDEYLDLPGEMITWMMNIDNIVQAEENRRNKAAQG